MADEMLKPALSVHVSEGGMDVFSASGAEETVLRLYEAWLVRMNKHHEETMKAIEARGGGMPTAPVPPRTPGTPIPFRGK